jgi:hypothetical protein
MSAEIAVPGPQTAPAGMEAVVKLRRWRTVQLAALALLFTLLNAVKPLQVDDGAYYYYALQMSRDPLRPYGFDMFWYSRPEPANDILAPPVLPYWWSLAIVLFGDNVFLWKLWLLPFSWLFVWSLAALFRRFARPLETPLLWLTVLSPTFLPSLNLMLDVPALALGLSAIVVSLRAAARDSLALAALAGLLAGLAMQTKYTAFLAPAAILTHGLLFRHRCRAAHHTRSPILRFLFEMRTPLVAVATAALLFIAWEAYVVEQHGESHFLHHARDADDWLLPRDRVVGWWEGVWLRIVEKSSLFWPLLPVIGGVSPAVIALGLAALGVRRWMVALAGGLMVLGYILVAALQADFMVRIADGAGSRFGLGDPERLGPLTLEQVLFGVYGVVLMSTMLCLLWQLWIAPRRAAEPLAEGGELEPTPIEEVSRNGSTWQRRAGAAFGRVDSFLVLWLGLELAGYFGLTPFSAVRRVMGLVVVSTLLAGRLAARTCRQPDRHTLVWAIMGGGVALGLIFYVIDLHDAFAEKRAAEQAADFIRAEDPGARIWYVGHWGFQHYAERAGMLPVVPAGYAVPPSVLLPGDWLVKPDERLEQQRIRLDRTRAQSVSVIAQVDVLPLRTVQCYYGGFAPVEHHQGPRIEVEIFRITAPWAPRSANR